MTENTLVAMKCKKFESPNFFKSNDDFSQFRSIKILMQGTKSMIVHSIFFRIRKVSIEAYMKILKTAFLDRSEFQPERN